MKPDINEAQTTDPGGRRSIRDQFRKFAVIAAQITGSAGCFIFSVLLIVVWALSYPLFKHYPDGFNTWQLIINSITNIITFLMVFLIQNMQNRDAKAFHLKLDELIRAVHSARNEMVSLEKLSEDEIKRLELEFERIHKTAKAKATSTSATDAQTLPQRPKS